MALYPYSGSYDPAQFSTCFFCESFNKGLFSHDDDSRTLHEKQLVEKVWKVYQKTNANDDELIIPTKVGLEAKVELVHLHGYAVLLMKTLTDEIRSKGAFFVKVSDSFIDISPALLEPFKQYLQDRFHLFLEFQEDCIVVYRDINAYLEAPHEKSPEELASWESAMGFEYLLMRFYKKEFNEAGTARVKELVMLYERVEELALDYLSPYYMGQVKEGEVLTREPFFTVLLRQLLGSVERCIGFHKMLQSIAMEAYAKVAARGLYVSQRYFDYNAHKWSGPDVITSSSPLYEVYKKTLIPALEHDIPGLDLTPDRFEDLAFSGLSLFNLNRNRV